MLKMFRNLHVFTLKQKGIGLSWNENRSNDTILNKAVLKLLKEERVVDHLESEERKESLPLSDEKVVVGSEWDGGG